MLKFNSIEEALEAMSKGGLVVVIDDADRENEGDLVMAAEAVTPAAINFMATEGRGLICAPVSREIAIRLGLHPMVPENSELYSCNFTVSVDYKIGTSTGISASDRARTITALVDEEALAGDFMRPGHIFPLIAKDGGVLVRAGHTEASVDLAKLAGFKAAGVLCEIAREDGEMMRTAELLEFAKHHNLPVITIKDLIAYRRMKEKLVELVAESLLPTRHGDFRMKVYKNILDDSEHVALVRGEILPDQPVLVRVHSECLTGEVFGSLRCDCGPQLDLALSKIAEEGVGVLLYMRQEGRGIGLTNKIKAYALQDKGLDTVEANTELGFDSDLRDYGIGAQILSDLGCKNLRILTNNPRKIVGLEGYGLKVSERLPLSIKPNESNLKYLTTKRDKLGHLI